MCSSLLAGPVNVFDSEAPVDVKNVNQEHDEAHQEERNRYLHYLLPCLTKPIIDVSEKCGT